MSLRTVSNIKNKDEFLHDFIILLEFCSFLLVGFLFTSSLYVGLEYFRIKDNMSNIVWPIDKGRLIQDTMEWYLIICWIYMIMKRIKINLKNFMNYE